MKQLVAEYAETKKISIKDMFASLDHTTTCKILAYRANGRRNDTLALLQAFDDGTYGWVYLADLIKGYSRPGRAAFCADSMTKALKAVIKADRTTYVFDSLHEFITYAAKISEPG